MKPVQCTVLDTRRIYEYLMVVLFISLFQKKRQMLFIVVMHLATKS